MVSYLFKLYQYFQRKIKKNELYVFKPTQKDITSLNNFLKYLESKIEISSLGERYFFEFVSSQFKFFSELKKSRAGDSIYFNFIFNKKSVDRYLNRKDSSDYYLSLFLNKYHCSLENVSNVYYKRNLLDFSYEEEIKESKNGKERLLNCINFTTLYNQKSEICKGCEYIEECKSILKLFYPSIFNLRFKNEEKSVKETIS
jgi:hypothetical protein